MSIPETLLRTLHNNTRKPDQDYAGKWQPQCWLMMVKLWPSSN